MRKTWLLILLAFALFLSACANGQEAGGPTVPPADPAATVEPGGSKTPNPNRPVTQALRDALGRDVETAVNPERVISLSPATTEILYALDCGKNVMAVDINSDYPAEVNVMPKLEASDVKEIAALDPQVVFVGRAYDAALIEQLEEQGIGVVCAEAATYEELYGNIALVGLVMGKDTSELVLSMQDTVQEVRAAASEQEPVTVYIALGFGPNEHVSVGDGTLVSTMIKTAGGIPVMEESGQVAVYGTEKLIDMNPQVLLVSSSLDLEALKAYEGYRDLPAVQEGRIYVIDEELLRPGPRVVQGMRDMQEAIEMSATS